MPAATMKVKGSTLLSRRAMLAERIGVAAYDAFVADFASKNPTFPQPMLASTLIPVDLFLAFNDELVRRFFGGSHDIWWEIGEKSAEFFSTQGPYVDSFYRGDYHRFWSKLPMIWKTLYTEGEARASESPGGLLEVELDCPVAHPYFELSTIGFVKRGLEMKAGRKVEVKRVSGFERGNKVQYRFQLPVG